MGPNRPTLAGRPCDVFNSDLRIPALEADHAACADALVICGKVERAPDDDCAVTNPVVIIEVFSGATEAADRGEKFAHQRLIPSLRDHVLVSDGGVATPASIEAELRVDAIYPDPTA